LASLQPRSRVALNRSGTLDVAQAVKLVYSFLIY
jgi:hypothetical protein